MIVSPGRLDDISAALADFVDLKSPYLHGHSTGTNRLASGAAQRIGLESQDATQLRQAALLHDLGRIGVANGIWQKPGPLTPAEFEHVRLHPY